MDEQSKAAFVHPDPNGLTILPEGFTDPNQHPHGLVTFPALNTYAAELRARGGEAAKMADTMIGDGWYAHVLAVPLVKDEQVRKALETEIKAAQGQGLGADYEFNTWGPNPKGPGEVKTGVLPGVRIQGPTIGYGQSTTSHPLTTGKQFVDTIKYNAEFEISRVNRLGPDPETRVKPSGDGKSRSKNR